MSESIENQIWIGATASQVERCFTEQGLMHQWLNPMLCCEPVGDWRVTEGSQMRFVIQLPLVVPALMPTLLSTVVVRSPGLVVWEFEGFFRGRDRWECIPEDLNGKPGTRLLNRFEFSIPNPVVGWGFKTFAAAWTQQDMAAQLRRLKQVAERL
ncbi:MAG: SRPBCC family protein [Synechococcales cyanobacterium RM1_1_8]|nr:SRPBCC family protein [Synechococcales cyanobacterium RM1_1_8]